MNETKKFNSNIRIFKVLTLVSLILFFLIALLFTYILFMTFLQLNYRFFFIHLLLIFQSVSAWIGMVLVIISKKKIKHDYAQIPSSHKKYMIGIGLIIISFGMISIFIVFLTSNPTSSFAILVSIISIVSILGFLTSWFFLKKAKLIFNENTELILESKNVKETEKLKILYCPRCKTKVSEDSTSCPLCKQDFKEFPPITREEKSFRYCPRCQKNVKPKKKFSAGYWIVIIIIGFVLFNLTGLFGIIATIGLLLVTAIRSPRCSNCKKKTESPRFLQPRSIPQIQEQESNPQ